MNWYLIHTKPRLEQCALHNLQQQGFECFLPLIRVEKLLRNALIEVEEPLFPRYLFIQLGTGNYAKSWHSIRSTRGVTSLVTFGCQPAKIGENLITLIRSENRTAVVQRSHFMAGEQVVITRGAFAGLNAIYQMSDGARRVMVLIEMLNRPVQLALEPASVAKFCKSPMPIKYSDSVREMVVKKMWPGADVQQVQPCWFVFTVHRRGWVCAFEAVTL